MHELRVGSRSLSCKITEDWCAWWKVTAKQKKQQATHLRKSLNTSLGHGRGSGTPSKCCFFIWLVAQVIDYLSLSTTRSASSHQILLCDQEEETIQHLLILCICQVILLQSTAKGWFANSVSTDWRHFPGWLVVNYHYRNQWWNKKGTQFPCHLRSLDNLEAPESLCSTDPLHVFLKISHSPEEMQLRHMASAQGLSLTDIDKECVCKGS